MLGIQTPGSLSRGLRLLLEPLPIELLGCACLADCLECTELLFLRSDSPATDLFALPRNRNDLLQSILSDIFQLIPRRHSPLARTLRENEKLGLVLLQTVNIPLQALHALVLPTVINCNSDRRGKRG